MKKGVRVLGFGDNVVDKYEHISTMYPGGNCVNFAVYAKMLKVDKAAYMGYFGNDAEAEHVIHCLRKIGIEMIKCRQLEGENGCARVLLQDGERIFKGSNQGGIRGKTSYCLDTFDLEYMNQFDLVHSGNYSFTEKELWKLRKENIPVSFDFSDIYQPDYMEDICSKIRYAFISCAKETEEAVKEKLECMKSWGVEAAVATRGSQSVIGFDGKQFYTQEPVYLEKVVDTMGAGDSFITAFLIDIIRQTKDQKSDFRSAMEKAVTFAASICMVEGAFGYGKKYEEERREQEKNDR